MTPPLPADAAATQNWNPQHDGTTLEAVVCSAADSCVAPAAYIVSSRAVDLAIDTLSGGTWTAAKAPLPPGAATTKQNAAFEWAICPAAADCLAVGRYTVQNGSTQALIETATDRQG